MVLRGHDGVVYAVATLAVPKVNRQTTMENEPRRRARHLSGLRPT